MVFSGGGGDREKWMDSIAVLKGEMSGVGRRSKECLGLGCTMDGGIHQDGEDGRAHSGIGRLQSSALATFCVTPTCRHQVDG